MPVPFLLAAIKLLHGAGVLHATTVKGAVRELVKDAIKDQLSPKGILKDKVKEAVQHALSDATTRHISDSAQVACVVGGKRYSIRTVMALQSIAVLRLQCDESFDKLATGGVVPRAHVETLVKESHEWLAKHNDDLDLDTRTLALALFDAYQMMLNEYGLKWPLSRAAFHSIYTTIMDKNTQICYGSGASCCLQ